MGIFKKINKDDLDRLFNFRYRESKDKIFEGFREKIESQKEEANRKGLLHSGYYESVFMKLHLDKTKEVLNSMCDIYIDIYCETGIDERNRDILLKRIDDYVIGNLKSFGYSLQSNNSILSQRKNSIKTSYERELNKKVSNQKRHIEIEFLKGNRPSEDKQSKLIDKKDIKPPSWITTPLWLLKLWKYNKLIFLICLLIGLIIFFKYLGILDWVWERILFSIDFYF